MPPRDKTDAATSLATTLAAAGLLGLSALAWAGNYIVGRAIAGEVPPAGLSAARWTLAVLLMLPLAWPHLGRDRPLLRARLGYMIVMGITGAGVFAVLQYGGLQFTTATNGGLISATSAVMVALAGVVLFRDRLSLRQIVGMAISMSGAVVIVAKGDAANLAGLRFNIGDLMILVTLASWGVYCALLRKKPAVHWTSFTLALFVVALVTTIPLAIIEAVWHRPPPLSLATLGAMIYTGVISSVVGFVTWNRGVELIGSARAGVFLNLIPLLTVLLAVLLLGERVQLYHGIACVLVFGGLWLASASGLARRA